MWDVRKKIQFCIDHPNDFALHFIYVKNDEVCTRVVSPYQFQASNRFIGFCLSAEDMRSFKIDRITKAHVVSVNDVEVPFVSTVVNLPVGS